MLFEEPIGIAIEERFSRRPRPRRRADGRADRHLRRRPRPVPRAEPLLPLPRDRRRHRRLGRTGRRDGRAHRRAGRRRAWPRAPRSSPGTRRPGSRPTATRAEVTFRTEDDDGDGDGRGRTSWSTRRPQALAALLGEEPPPAAEGRPAEGQHAAAPAAEAARPDRRPARGVRRDVPYRRGLRAVGDRVPGGRRAAGCRPRRRPRSTATR